MAMLRGIQASHLAGEYSDIAYNMAVDQFGNLYVLRGMEHVGGATYGANAHTRAVVWLGSSDVERPSDAALRAIGDLWRSERGVNLTADASLTGHRDWTSTACPGEVLYGLLDTVRNGVVVADVPPPSVDEEEFLMLVTWVVPTGMRYIADARTGASRTAEEAFPAGTQGIEAKVRSLVSSGAMKDLGAVDWEQNWVLRMAPSWPLDV